jgi:putative tryptophan/tyrosine transport system substrate-binding protein
MRRRDFLGTLGGAAAAWPLAARGQQAGKLPTIGVLGTSSALVWSPWMPGFVQRLRELGWAEGRNLTIEYRWAEGRPIRFAEIAAEFVWLKVDVIVTAGSSVPAVKQATSIIPIVFAISGDALAGGLVASLARPGGNATGLSLQGGDLAGKRFELLREVVPRLRSLAILGNVAFPDAVAEMGGAQSAARRAGLDVTMLEIRRPEDIGPALDTVKDQVGALYVAPDGLVSANRTRIITFALSARLPTIFNGREYADAGGLMSYGPNFTDMFRRSAELVDKILRGAKPGDLPVEQPTKFDLVVNLSTAKALGITMPPTIIARANEVIE